MKSGDGKIIEGAGIILFRCGNLKRGEKVCIVSEPVTADIGRALYRAACDRDILAEHLVINAADTNSQEPPKAVAARMLKSDLVVGVTRLSMAHTETRYNITRNGARYLSLPGYSLDMLKHQALRVDFKAAGRKAKLLAEKLTRSGTAAIRTRKGTSLLLDIKGREGNFCPGYVDKYSKIGSPPDIEVNIAPIEGRSEGIIVVDGSVAHSEFSRLKRPIYMTIKNGKVVHMEGESACVKKLNRMFLSHGGKSRVLAELGVGFNKKAKVCGNMLLDEGSYGAFHIGFGSNSTIGGKNKVNFHIDVVFYADEIILDDRTCAV